MPQFQRGLHEADRLASRAPEDVEYWLGRALRGRRRWKTRLFDRKKLRFLDGFVAGLEAYLQKLRTGQKTTPPQHRATTSP